MSSDLKTIVIDLDNTVAIYDDIIKKICNDKHIKLPSGYNTKSSISSYLKRNGMNHIWTEFQGLCYGPMMQHAKVADAFIEYAAFAKGLGYSLILVSHKTQFPASGLNFDLRQAAKNWIDLNLGSVFDEIFFENTFDNKIEKIHSINPDFLIDDLQAVLLKANLGKEKSFLINNVDAPIQSESFVNVGSWRNILETFMFGDFIKT
jgi:hypothetical protein